MDIPFLKSRGGLFLKGGGLRRSGGGLVDIPAAISDEITLNGLTPDQVAAILGKPAPTIMWDCGVASGAEDLVGSDDLSDTVAGTKEVNDAALGGLTTDITGALQKMEAASNTVADVGSETVTGIWIGRFTSFPSTTSVFGKRDSASPNYGYEIYNSATGHVTFVEDGPSGATTRTIAISHGTINPQVILFTREFTANNCSVYSREGSSTGTRFAQSLATTRTLAIGSTRLAATLARHGKLLLWIGSDGDGFDNTDRLALAQALGLE